MSREISGLFNQGDIDRFLSKVSYSTNGCWAWGGSRHKRLGHGYFSIKHKVIYAHRFSYSVFIGDIPNGLLVCHRCDNGWCVNPNHLFIGTPKDNVADMIAKGRSNTPSGSDAGSAKLSLEQICEIFKFKGIRSSREVGGIFGVSHTAILDIWNGDSYKKESKYATGGYRW